MHIIHNFRLRYSHFISTRLTLVLYLTTGLCTILCITPVDKHFYFNIKDGLAFRSSPDRLPCSEAIVPAAAIIAALSVHKLNGGMRRGIFKSENSLSKADRNPLFAATLPATITCLTSYSLAARLVFFVNTSMTLA